MAREMLYPDEHPQVHRHSSLEQYKGYFSTMTRGGWTPIVFDQLDGISCSTIKTHPVIISLVNDLGYHFPEDRCTYASEKFIYVDKEGVEQRLLPTCYGGSGGEWYEQFIKSNTFINFDDSSLGVRNTQELRVGLDYVTCDKTLPAAE